GRVGGGGRGLPEGRRAASRQLRARAAQPRRRAHAPRALGRGRGGSDLRAQTRKLQLRGGELQPRPSACASRRVGARYRGVDAHASVVLRNARAASSRPVVANRDSLDFLRRARAAREGGRGEEALALYRRAVESNGGYFAPANLELAYTLAGLSRNEEAAASVLSVIRRDGTRYPI